MDRKFIRHIKRQQPSLDIYRKFMFFSNSKTGQKPILWNLLKDRAIIAVRGYRNGNYTVFFYSFFPEEFDKVFKFTIVRNPWDRILSTYCYMLETGRIKVFPDFNEFVKKQLLKYKEDPRKLDKHFHHQWPKIIYKDTGYIDFIGKFERLKTDWGIIASKIECPAILPHDNKTNHTHYTKYYNDESIDIVYQIYKKDIKMFGYDYGI